METTQTTVIQDWIDRAEALLVHYDHVNDIPLILHHIFVLFLLVGKSGTGNSSFHAGEEEARGSIPFSVQPNYVGHESINGLLDAR